MRYARDGFSIESSIRKNRQLPQWYLDEPEIEAQDVFYIKAFYDLNTCRAGGMGLCPIPWRDIVHYAEFYQLDCDIVEAFIDIIREMDGAYMQWQNDEAERKKPKAKTPPPR